MPLVGAIYALTTGIIDFLGCSKKKKTCLVEFERTDHSYASAMADYICMTIIY